MNTGDQRMEAKREPEPLLIAQAAGGEESPKQIRKAPSLPQAGMLILVRNTTEILHKKADFSITQTCFKEPALKPDVSNCATLSKITTLGFTFFIS